MIKTIIKVFTILLFATNILFAQEEYFVQVNPATCSYTILDSIPLIHWIIDNNGTSAFDKKNRRYIFIGQDASQATTYLCSIDATTGTTVSIPPINGNFGGLKFDNSTGILYGIHYTTSIATADFVSINPTTGALTIISHINITSSSYDVTSDDVHHRYIFSAVDSTGNICLFTIDMATGNVISKPSIGNTLNGLQYDNTNGNLYGLQSNNSLHTFYFDSINIATANPTIIHSIPLITGIDPSYITFDELNQRYTFKGSDNSGDDYLCTINPTNGQVVFNPFFPGFASPYNLLETEYDNSIGNLYALHWGPIGSSGTTPPIPIAANDTICYNHTASLSAVGTGTLGWYSAATYGTYLGGGSNFTTSVLTNDTTFYVQDSNSTGSSSRAAVTVKVNPLPVIHANASVTAMCIGGSTILTGSGAHSYIWTVGITDGVSFVPSQTNTYTVIGTDTNNCSNTAATTIHVNPLPAVTANASANTVCAGTSVTLTGKGANTYSWTGGITNGVSFVPLQTNTYTLTGTDGNNCSDTDTTTITVNPFVTTASITASATTVCSGITIILTGTGAAAYLWSTGATAAAITISASGVYWLEDNSLQCSNKDSITITQIPTPTINLGNNITVCEGQTATLNGGVASSYLWSNGATTASITISTAGTYWLQANNGQCLDKDSLSVYFYDCEIEVPNVFTPNNDGVNDVFTITTKNITLLNCKIYNRWGTIVGELKNITDGWDGRTKSGVDCTEGVYYFIAEYKDSTGINNVKKGFLQLIR